jgi:glutamine synthetase
MGILKNYEAVNPFISATSDAFNRLKPGFEAPVCVVTSLGLSPEVPSRNRTILAGVIRDIDNPLATRFEMRSPNPYTNTYIAIAAFYLAALDGMKACAASGRTLKQLEREISKKYGQKGFYLEKNREYRTEQDVFEHFTEEERRKRFGEPPATVWENMQGWEKYPEKKQVLMAGGILTQQILDSFEEGALIRWKTEILNRIIPQTRLEVQSCKALHDETATAYDKAQWKKVQEVREKLAKDSSRTSCVFTEIRKAMEAGDYSKASDKFLEMQRLRDEMVRRYHVYAQNILD